MSLYIQASIGAIVYRRTAIEFAFVPPLACYNFDTRERIIIFVAEMLLSTFFVSCWAYYMMVGI